MPRQTAFHLMHGELVYCVAWITDIFVRWNGNEALQPVSIPVNIGRPKDTIVKSHVCCGSCR